MSNSSQNSFEIADGFRPSSKVAFGEMRRRKSMKYLNEESERFKRMSMKEKQQFAVKKRASVMIVKKDHNRRREMMDDHKDDISNKNHVCILCT